MFVHMATQSLFKKKTNKDNASRLRRYDLAPSSNLFLFLRTWRIYLGDGCLPTPEKTVDAFNIEEKWFKIDIDLYSKSSER